MLEHLEQNDGVEAGDRPKGVEIADEHGKLVHTVGKNAALDRALVTEDAPAVLA